VLTASLIAAMGLSGVPDISVAVVPISRCGDMAGKGYTLRTGIAAAQEGDTIDLNALPLTCSTITLTGGEIPISRANLTISGAIGRTVTVSGNNVGRVFYHTGGGTLTLTGFEVAYGSTVGNGGCIYSNGGPNLSGMIVSHCHATNGGGLYSRSVLQATHVTDSMIVANTANGGGAGIWQSGGALYAINGAVTGNIAGGSGGGIYNAGGLSMTQVSVTDNQSGNRGGGIFERNGVALGSPLPIYLAGLVIDHNTAAHEGGGVFSSNDVKLTLSLVSNNTAGNSAGGGGLAIDASYAFVFASTIAGNTANGTGAQGGGIKATLGGALHPKLSVIDSTISGNNAWDGSGIYGNTSPAGDFFLYNSTVAFDRGYLNGAGVGVHVVACQATLHSSILARSTDFDAAAARPDLLFASYCNDTTVLGAHNLIMSSPNTLPGDTIANDPNLAPLALHGGALPTHPLSANSIAVDGGDNPLNLAEDERGGTRKIGAASDIGAYERQVNDDELFYGGFD